MNNCMMSRKKVVVEEGDNEDQANNNVDTIRRIEKDIYYVERGRKMIIKGEEGKRIRRQSGEEEVEKK